MIPNFLIRGGILHSYSYFIDQSTSKNCIQLQRVGEEFDKWWTLKMVAPDCPIVSTCLGVCEGAKEESCWELIENDGGQGNSTGMGLLYLHPGGVCLRVAQNHLWQDKKK